MWIKKTITVFSLRILEPEILRCQTVTFQFESSATLLRLAEVCNCRDGTCTCSVSTWRHRSTSFGVLQAVFKTIQVSAQAYEPSVLGLMRCARKAHEASTTSCHQGWEDKKRGAIQTLQGIHCRLLYSWTRSEFFEGRYSFPFWVDSVARGGLLLAAAGVL